MIGLVSGIFAIFTPLALLFAAFTITAVVTTTNQRSGVDEDTIDILAKTTVWMFRVAVASLALAGFPAVIVYLTTTL